jgi:probable F420-dependent oxidoreductase
VQPTVRTATGAELPALVRSLGQRDFFTDRLERQRAGRGVLLVAWLAGNPVGDVYLRLEPADEPEVRRRLPEVPLLQHLEVTPEYRNRRIGSTLIGAAELALRERGHLRVALGVALDNHGAARLYLRHGYRQWPHPPVLTSYPEQRPDRSIRRRYELCQILVKDLTGAPGFALGEPGWTRPPTAGDAAGVRMRFGLVWRGDRSPVEVARRAEDTGYATLLFPDHTGMVAPLPAMAAAAAVTSRIRIGTQVVNIAFRPLGALAQEAAAVDLISDGRLELGLGAGYAEPEVRSLGLPFPGHRTRIAAVARALDLLPRLFAGETLTERPGPGRLVGFGLDPLPPQGSAVPMLVGGNGDRMLAVAARGAQTVQFTGFTAPPSPERLTHFTTAGLADRVEHVRRVAGDRFPRLELSLLVQHARVVPDPRAVAAGLAGEALSVEQALDSPFLLLGSVEAICDRLEGLSQRFGISYVTVLDGRQQGFDQVVARLAGG